MRQRLRSFSSLTGHVLPAPTRAAYACDMEHPCATPAKKPLPLLPCCLGIKHDPSELQDRHCVESHTAILQLKRELQACRHRDSWLLLSSLSYHHLQTISFIDHQHAHNPHEQIGDVLPIRTSHVEASRAVIGVIDGASKPRPLLAPARSSSWGVVEACDWRIILYSPVCIMGVRPTHLRTGRLLRFLACSLKNSRCHSMPSTKLNIPL